MTVSTLRAPGRAPAAPGSRRRPPLPVILGALLVGIVALAVAGLCVGAPLLSPAEALRALADTSGSTDGVIVRTIRFPRVVMGVTVGAALAVAGVLMQALTRNPLADPGILGVNAGAALAVAVGFVVLGVRDFGSTLVFALVGAAAASLVVWVLGGGARSPITRLVVAGVAVAAVLSGVTQGLALLNTADYALIRVWEAGSLTARDGGTAVAAAIVVVVASLGLMSLGPTLNLIVLGEDQAHALGAGVVGTRTAGLVGIVVLTATATAVAGPIAFVGLLVPHALRGLVGQDQVRLLWLSAVGGPLLLLACDIVARTAIAPAELPIGVVTALIGAPLLIILVQRGSRGTARSGRSIR